MAQELLEESVTLNIDQQGFHTSRCILHQKIISFLDERKIQGINQPISILLDFEICDDISTIGSIDLLICSPPLQLLITPQRQIGRPTRLSISTQAAVPLNSDVEGLSTTRYL